MDLLKGARGQAASVVVSRYFHVPGVRQGLSGYHPYDGAGLAQKAFDRVSPDVGRLSPEVIVTRESLGGGHDDTAPAMTPVFIPRCSWSALAACVGF